MSVRDSAWIRDRVVLADTGCWEWQNYRLPPWGYGRFTVKSRPTGYVRTFFAHRASYEIHVGPIPSGMVVCHRCDNPPCVNPDHLFLGTPADNMRDMRDKGRCSRWLTREQVAQVKELLAAGVPGSDVARTFGVSPASVSAIRCGRSWAA